MKRARAWWLAAAAAIVIIVGTVVVLLQPRGSATPGGGGATLSGPAAGSRSSAPTTVATPFAAVPRPTQSLPVDHPFSNAAQLLADVGEDLASYGERFTAWQSDGHISGIGGICVTTMGGDPDPCPVYATTYATSASGESVGVVGCRYRVRRWSSSTSGCRAREWPIYRTHPRPSHGRQSRCARCHHRHAPRWRSFSPAPRMQRGPLPQCPAGASTTRRLPRWAQSASRRH